MRENYINILKLFIYNFLQETVNARDNAAFHLQFFESLNLTLGLLRVTVDSVGKTKSVLRFYMYACACICACVLKGQTVNPIHSVMSTLRCVAERPKSGTLTVGFSPMTLLLLILLLVLALCVLLTSTSCDSFSFSTS